MRVKITDLNEPWPNGVVIAPGALKLNRDFVPVTRGFDISDVIGKANNLTETDGAVYMDVEFFHVDEDEVKELVGADPEENVCFGPTIYSTTMETPDNEASGKRITSAQLGELRIQYAEGVLPKKEKP